MRRILLGLLVFILVGLAWVGYEAHSVYTAVSATYHPAPRIAIEPKATPVTNFFGTRRINILLLGSDNDAKFELQRWPLTQSMIVVSIDPVHDTVNMLSIPRDFWVPIPQYGWGKIDTASELGGASLARATVESLFHITIDYYAWVGLSGFSKLVDAFGGVTINITHPILDDFYPNDQNSRNPYAYLRLFIPPGWHHLSGRQALEYVRSRHGDLAGDFGRSQRQQQVLLQLRRQASGWNLVFKIPQLASSLSTMLRTDLQPARLLDLARLSRLIRPASIHRVVLSAPTYCAPGISVDGQDILIPNWTAINPVAKKLFAPISLSGHRTKTEGVETHSSTPPAATPTWTDHHSLTHHAGRPTSSSPPSRLPGSIIYAANGTFYRLDPNGRTADIMPAWMTAAGMPALSSGGQRLAFMRWAPNASNIDIYNLQTHEGPRQITQDAPADPTFISNGVWAAWPSWSADGNTIIFSSDRYKLGTYADQSRMLDLAIYVESPFGGKLRQVTDPSPGAGGDTDPQFVGTTTNFLYVHWAYHYVNGIAVGQPFSQLVIRNLSNLSQSWTLTRPSGQIVQPALDPTGRRIAYIASNGGTSRLVVARLQRHGKRFHLSDEKTISTGEIAQPAFSRNGKWVSYLRADGNGFALYVESANGGPAEELSAAGTNVDAMSRPIWTP